MSKKPIKKSSAPVGFREGMRKHGFTEYVLKSNGLRVLCKHMPETGVVTTNITYRVGSKDEVRGETGLAHMLEHMLFKPTKRDVKKKIDSSAMQFERDTGAILNANTYKDRTTYFFSYPKEHLSRVLEIEADRMVDVVLTDKEFIPERNNVLSEFDMYFGSPEFALEALMLSSAFQSHSYRHETIGFREDIEDYTVEKLQQFYKSFYRPDNATLTIVGDFNELQTLKDVKKIFGLLQNPSHEIPRIKSREPKQEGKRTVSISRPSNSNLLAIGVFHEGFPSEAWYTSAIALSVLADNEESILHKALVDTGKAANIEAMIGPTSERNLALLFITLSDGSLHSDIEKEVLGIVAGLKEADIKILVKKVVAKEVTDALFTKTSSLSIAMEMTEHIAAGNWGTFCETESVLKKITPKAVLLDIQKMFTEEHLVIGTFIGKK